MTSPAHKAGWGWHIPAGGLALLLFGGAALYWTMHRSVTIDYVTLPVTRGAVVRAVTASGTVNPVITIQVGTYVSGVIQARYCDYNTEVKKGQLCAKVDPRPYQIIVDQDKANLAVAKAQLEKDNANLAYAKIVFERKRGLLTRQAVSQDAFDNAKNVYDQTQAQVDLDEASIALRTAELKAAEINLGYTDIIAPVDGTVVSRNVEMGQTVAASFQTPTLFLVATALTVMQLDTNVSESDIGLIKLGGKASFTVESFPHRPFEGKITQIRQSPQPLQNVVTYDAVISVPNKDLLLKPGMTATAQIIVESRDDVLRVSDIALRYMPGGLAALTGAPVIGPETPPPGSGTSQIFVLRNGRPTSMTVETGLGGESFTEIVRGDLKLGDEVIVGEESGATGKSTRSGLPASPPTARR